MIYEIAIIGAGASGLMLASHIKNKSVCLIDSNKKIGQKIKVSGGAKCNITNNVVSCDNYLGDKEFVKKVLKNYTNNDLLEFLNANNVQPKINPKLIKGTYFCRSSQDVIDMFTRLTTHVKKYLDTKVLDVEHKDELFIIKTSKGEIKAKKLVVASGGLSYSTLGASSIAFDIAKKFNHTITKLEPALVGFTVQKEQFWFKQLSGLSIIAKAKVENKSFYGSLLFAHKGCSGPIILNSSLYWKKGKISFDFLPKEKIEKLLKGNALISSKLPLPKRFVQEFLDSIEIKDKPCSLVTNDELKKLQLIHNYELSPAGNFGYTKAEVTKGGVDTSQIDVNSMQSLKQKNLYFLGECLDVTGELGGYNFQFAFSSAMTCSYKI
ncbi:aminoacetone oxidase family FAD-binding enzyme [Malaciobacter mytili]|uniref:NAD(P)/FAD-dependent oxidoreductase n=1 Tax=Malaciobacter mytili TaxID=603050 RepID=UPI00100AA8CE|nr:aminoacetone oxidase family FAD-binding enzyme [Malaciobacter mytili]RXI46681.1 aminoacetone oxidase family FAD-binding enzyme [Malaciobacter mytili]